MHGMLTMPRLEENYQAYKDGETNSEQLVHSVVTTPRTETPWGCSWFQELCGGLCSGESLTLGIQD